VGWRSPGRVEQSIIDTAKALTATACRQRPWPDLCLIRWARPYQVGPATVPRRLATKEASTLVRQRRSAVGAVDKQNDKQRVSFGVKHARCPAEVPG
jgi:hypothetical protein